MGNSSLSCLPPSPLAFDQLGPSATAMDVIECARNVPNLLDEISNKVAIVTGGSSGIGKQHKTSGGLLFEYVLQYQSVLRSLDRNGICTFQSVDK